MNIRVGMAVTALLAVSVSFGKDMYGGYGDVNSVSNAENVTWSGVLSVGDGELHKSGAGTLTLNRGSVFLPQTLRVHEGQVNLSAGGTVPAIAQPECLSRAAMWLSAKDGERKMSMTGDGRIEKWFDVRETDTSAPTYMFGLSTNSFKRAGDYGVLSSFGGNAAAYFGGYGSGQALTYRNANGKLHSAIDVCHYFVVHAVTKNVGALAGGTITWGKALASSSATIQDSAFHVVNYSASMTNTRNVAYMTIRYSQDDLRFQANGVSCAAHLTRPVENAWELATYSCRIHRQRIDGLLCQGLDQSDSACRGGGDYVSEVILFNTRLSDAELAEVNAYLMAKWGVSDRSVPAMDVAAGASVSYEVASGETVVLPALKGEGLFVKTGGGILEDGKAGAACVEAPVDLQAGTVSSRNLAGYRMTGARTLSAARVKSGDELETVSTAAGDDGVFAKAGAEELRVGEAAADVASINVQAGRLILAGKGATGASAVNDGNPIEIIIKNPSFEQLASVTTEADGSKIIVRSNPSWAPGLQISSKLPGWMCRTGINPGTTGSQTDQIRQILSTITTEAAYFNGHPTDGTNTLSLSRSAEIYQDIEIPVAGRVEVTASVAAQWAGSVGANDTYKTALNAYLLDRSSVETDGSVATNFLGRLQPVEAFVMTPSTLSADIAKPGTYRLVFYGLGTGSAWTQLDDIRARVYPSVPGKRRVLVPGGDFESGVSWSATYSDPSEGGYLEQRPYVGRGTSSFWTFDQQDQTTKWPAVGLVGPRSLCRYGDGGTGSMSLSQCGWGDYPYFQFRRLPYGGFAALGFFASGSATVAAFTPPAGTWRLKAFVAPSGLNISSKNILSASVTAGGETVSLGSFKMTTAYGADSLWPCAFTTDGTTPVSITVSYVGGAKGAMTLDDFELVEAEAEAGIDDTELVTDGGFEGRGGESSAKGSSYTSWTVLNASGTEVTSFGEVGQFLYEYNGSRTPCNIVDDRWDGSGFAVMGTGQRLRQTVHFPSAGAYRLRFATKRRSDQYADYATKVAFTARVFGANAVTNVAVTVNPATSRYVAHEYVFTVDSEGDRTLEFQLAGADWQREIGVDGASIVKVATPSADGILDAEKSISVATGAKLYLGFTGCQQVKEVRLGGKRRSKIISAATYPEFIEGPGEVYVEPKGMTLLVR